MLLASILLLALTRAEILERFKAAPVTKVSGLVQVVADCPADMRREFQGPVATFVADVCRTLYRAENAHERPFVAPGIVVYVGDVRTNVTAVVVKPRTRHLPARARLRRRRDAAPRDGQGVLPRGPRSHARRRGGGQGAARRRSRAAHRRRIRGARGLAGRPPVGRGRRALP